MAIASSAGDHGSSLRDWLVAHRGWPDAYPENSLEGMQAVLEAGARFVEFDVQITADGHAVVIHDDDLDRLAGRRARVTGLSLAELQMLSVSSKAGTIAQAPTLAAMLSLIGHYPGVTAFVELKRQSIRRHGLHASVECVLDQIEAADCPVVFISFRWRAVRLAQKLDRVPVGWAFRPWSPLARWLSIWLKPDYLFVRADRVPRRPDPFWPGPWLWVVYAVADLASARELRARGVDLIEVDDLPGLIAADSGGEDARPT
ncbi:MAG: hypothetical protein EA419_01305 [Wenzhouxiangella sp.]|nr:MAG: hypothetical protein EA419_01305 [Wenzhouxiangella sp.]